jgi:hypothetical protein
MLPCQGMALAMPFSPYRQSGFSRWTFAAKAAFGCVSYGTSEDVP